MNSQSDNPEVKISAKAITSFFGFPVERNGIIVLLDALGSRSLTLDECRRFIDARNKVLKALEPIKKDAHNFLEQELTGKKNPPNAVEFLHEPELHTFGDTIILSWDVDNDARIIPSLLQVAVILGHLISLGIEHGLYFRGSVAAGKYLQQKNTLLGPAVVDAASWYEQTEWIGVIATPKTGLLVAQAADVARHVAGTTFSEFASLYAKYDVPIKTKTIKSLWASGWPIQYAINTKDAEFTPRVRLLEQLGQLGVPFGSEDKYLNTLRFYDHMIEFHDRKES